MSRHMPSGLNDTTARQIPAAESICQKHRNNVFPDLLLSNAYTMHSMACSADGMGFLVGIRLGAGKLQAS